MQEKISATFGSRRGMLRYFCEQTLFRLGFFARFREVDWRVVRRVVFVCKGNICRSPFAEVLGRGFGMEVSSFGLQAGVGSPADPQAIAIAKEFGVDLSAHSSCSRCEIKLSKGDLLVAMELGQAKELTIIAKDCGAQVALLGLFHSKPRAYIADPFGTNEGYFRHCFGVIEDAVKNLNQAAYGKFAAK